MRAPLVIFGFIASHLFATAACSKGSDSGSPLSSAKQGELTKALSALNETPPEMRGVFAASALAEIESERLPQPLVKTLEALAQVSPDMRAMIVSQGLAESMDSLETLCQGAGLN